MSHPFEKVDKIKQKYKERERTGIHDGEDLSEGLIGESVKFAVVDEKDKKVLATGIIFDWPNGFVALNFTKVKGVQIYENINVLKGLKLFPNARFVQEYDA